MLKTDVRQQEWKVPIIQYIEIHGPYLERLYTFLYRHVYDQVLS